METGGRYIWHHRLHEEWGSERLFFWRLAFFPTYEKEKIKLALEAALAEHAVESYAMYELLGFYDVLLRTWLPTRTSQLAFETALRDKLSSHHLQVCDAFAVGATLRHWPWDDLPDPRPPARELLDEPWSDDRIALGNDLADGRPIDPVPFKDALAPCRHGEGIKFSMIVAASSQLLTIDARDHLRNLLTQTVTRAAGTGGGADSSAPALSELSLYEGSGFCQFLVLGRVQASSFFALRTEIIDPINEFSRGRWVGARSYTYVSAADRLPLFQDHLPRRGRGTARGPGAPNFPLKDYLQRDESQTLEVKASAFVNIGEWIRGGPLERDDRIIESLLRAVVGLLNAEGGTIIVGAVEQKRFPDWRRGVLMDAPECGDYVVVGLAPDLQGKDWDEYARRLQAVINTRINPPPTGLVTVVKDVLEARLMCVIAIQQNDREWFYLKSRKDGPERFFVRRGNETLEYAGPVADAYKRANRRD
jgi:hypothetical protein